MVPTLRLAATVFVSGALMAASGRWQILLPASLLLLSMAAALAALECRWLREARLDVVRLCDEKLSLGAANLVRITLRNSSYRRLRGVVRDEYPEGFSADGGTASFDLPPRSERELAYRVTPARRGRYAFGDTFVRIYGPFGLAVRQIRYPAAAPVKVYPNLLDMRRYDIALRRERALPAGRRAARIRGNGTDFESLRDYTPDDDFRAVDWKATARRGRLTARQYQEEKSQNITLVLDCGRIMGPVVGGLTRLDHSINAAVMIAHAASIKGDRVGMMAFDDGIRAFLPPRPGRSQALRMLGLAYDLQDAEGDSDYARAASYLSSRCGRRGLVLLFTDLVDPESSAPLIGQIARMSRKHLCVCACISDPAVQEAATNPARSLEDAYTAAAARQVIQARKAAAAAAAAAGAIVVDVPPSGLTPAVVNAYLDIKARGAI